MKNHRHSNLIKCCFCILFIAFFFEKGQAISFECTFNSPNEYVQQSEKAAKDSVIEEKVFVDVEMMPSFPGGNKALLKYIYNNIHYPEDAENNNTEGKVFVQFTVTKTGEVVNTRVVKGISTSLDNEATRIVNSLPDWIPGEQNGKKVNVLYTLPINFRLNPSLKSSMQKAAIVVNGKLMPAGFDMSTIDPKTIELVNVIKPDSTNKNPDIIDKNREFAKNGVIIIKTKESVKADSLKKKEDKENFIYHVIEQMPVFTGGERGLMNFISRNLKYPAESFKNKEQGKVVLRFVVTKTGRVEKAEVIRSVSFLLDREALRVVKMIPDFIPGKQNGKNVNVYYTVPISFDLNSYNSQPEYLINENKNNRSKNNYKSGF